MSIGVHDLTVFPRIPTKDRYHWFLEYNSKDVSGYVAPTPLATQNN